MNHKRKVRKRGKGGLLVIFMLGFLVGNIVTNIIFIQEGDIIEINIIYSSEKADWMTVAYLDFIEYWKTTHPNEPIKVIMHPYGSSDSMISILNGEIFPTIWSPASSIWMPFLNTKWAEYTGDLEPIINISTAVKIIYSPIVIATWESYYQMYGFEGFSDLHALNQNPGVTVRMAHTDPRLSNSGFMSVIMALSAASGVSAENLTTAELTNQTNQDWMKVFESSAVMYGKSTGFLSKYMKSGGPDELNIAFLYENLVSDISGTSEAGKIIAVYPEEGTLYSDHPFCILNADWITADQRRVAEEFLTFLQKNETVVSAMETGFRPIDTNIPLDPTVFNYADHGINFSISVPELHTPMGGVLDSIPDFWLLCKNTA